MMYDLAVIGCGGIGSAVLYHAARSGARVIGLEQFEAVHDRGSSHGHTRIIRQAYFEHPDYVPLLLDAYRLWSDLEETVGRSLYVQTGLLQAGPADGVVVPGVLKSARAHHLPIDALSWQEATERFPVFRIPDGHIAAFEHRAGYLFVEACVSAHLQAARAHGAEFLDRVRVESHKVTDNAIELATNQGPFRAQRLVITVGAWLPEWISGQRVSLEVLRKHLHWYHSSDRRVQQSQGCPLFFFENSIGCFYGFPAIDGQWGLKVAEHSGGQLLNSPDELDRSPSPDDQCRVDSFMKSYFHGQHLPQRHAVCMYTMTKDHHFLIDTHPNDDRVWIAGGFSGHGFKFASVLGQLIAEASLTGWRDQRLDFLRWR